MALYPPSPEFPTVHQLRSGILLGAIIDAIYQLPQESQSDRYRWEGNIRELYDGSETRGHISFTEDHIVGAFFFAESERSPYGEKKAPLYDAETFFTGAPPAVVEIARREIFPHITDLIGTAEAMDAVEMAYIEGTLERWLDEHEGSNDHRFVPLVTAAFWSQGEHLTSHDSWVETYHHGAHILENELLDQEEVLAAWANDMELAPERIALARQVFQRRLESSEPTIVLTTEEYARLAQDGTSQLKLVEKLLAAVGILLPAPPITGSHLAEQPG